MIRFPVNFNVSEFSELKTTTRLPILLRQKNIFTMKMRSSSVLYEIKLHILSLYSSKVEI